MIIEQKGQKKILFSNKISFLALLLLASSISLIILFDGVAFADIIPPKKQSSFGIII
jgi:hypothetical protein